MTSIEQQSKQQQNLNLFANSKDNVKVVIRVRPLNEREKMNGGHKKCFLVENESSIAIDGYKGFNYDYVADEEIPQNVIFQQIAQPIADCCLEGYNGTIFAYGQTGSGKTFTIQGPTNIENGEVTIFGSCNKKQGKLEENARGIMQRSFEYIFECLEQDRQKAETSSETYQFEYLIRCSYLEIYNEQILDLLEPSSANLHIREDIKKGVYVEGLQEEVVQSAEDMIALIQMGAKNRHVGSHAMNKESSRSHSVLTTIIETKSMKEGGGVWNIKTSRFHIIDLAGSERSKQTNAVGERLKEAGMINKSLSALGNVINSLVDISEGKSRHVHYRDSKLTFLLRDSLGGNSKTLIIANVSPSTQCHGETLSTLKFAQRAKLIRNKAVINEDSSGTIQLLKAEISRLKKDLAESEKVMKSIQDGNGNVPVSECSRCKAMFEGIDSEGNTQMEDDELLLSFDESNNPLKSSQGDSNALKKKLVSLQRTEIATLRQRVTHLESLLSANLDTLSTQQRYYDGEITKLQAQLKRMQQTVESYEKQSARDKMIIKFREERISKLEQGASVNIGGAASSIQPQPISLPVTDTDHQILELKKEVQMWKEAAEHNTQAAKLFAEKNDLQRKLDSINLEIKQQPESLSNQVRGLTEFNESLNHYLKSFCEESRRELEKELEKAKLDLAETVEDLNSRLREQELIYQQRIQHQETSYKESINSYRTEVNRLESRLSQERIDLTDTLARVKKDASVSEKLIRQQLSQMIEEEQLKYERLQKDREAEYNVKLQDSESEIERLRSQIIQLQAHIEQERKRQEQVLQVIEDRWEQKVNELELQINEQVNDKQIINQQYEETSENLQITRHEVEILNSQLSEKENAIENQNQIIHNQLLTLNGLQSQNSQFEQLISNLRQKIKLAEIQSQQTFEEMKQAFDQQNSLISTQLQQKNEQILILQSDFQNIEQETIDQKLQIKDLQKQIQELQGQLNDSISIHSQELQVLQSSHQTLLSELNQSHKSELQQLQQSHSEELKELQESHARDILSLESLLAQDKAREIEILIEESVTALNQQKQLTQSQIDSFQTENADIKQKMASLRQVNDQQTSQINQISESRDNLTKALENVKQNEQILKEQNLQLEELRQQLTIKLQQSEETRQSQEIQLKDVNDQQRELIEALERENQQNSTLIQQLQTLYETSQTKIIQLTQERVSFIEKLDAEKKKFDELISCHYDERITQLQSQLTDYQAKIETLESQNTQMRQQLVQVIEEKDNQMKQLSLDQAQVISQIESQLERLSQERVEIEEEGNQLIQEERLQFKQEIQDITIKFEQMLQEKDRELYSLQENIKIQLHQKDQDQQNIVLRIQETIAVKNSQIDQQTANLKDLQQQIQIKSHDLQQHSQHLQKVSSALSDSQLKLQSYHQETTRLASQLEISLSQKDQLLKELSDLQTQRQRDLSEIDSLRAKLVDSYNLKEDLSSRLKDSEGQIETMLHENIKLEDTKQAQEVAINQMKIELHDLQVSVKKSAEIDAENTKIKELEMAHKQELAQLQLELATRDKQSQDLQQIISRFKKRAAEQEDQLRQSKETISMMLQKETQLQTELKQRYQELTQHEERLRKQLSDSRDVADRRGKEVENLKELVKIKDKQIEDYHAQDTRDRAAIDRIAKENKELKGHLSKREFEMKDLVKTFKFFTDEKNKLEKEVEKLQNENKQLIGHKNPSQKIQHHLKIKEENNRLREENLKLQDELRRKVDIIVKHRINDDMAYENTKIGASLQHQQAPSFEIAANRLIDHLLTQPSLVKAVGITDDFSDQLLNQESCTTQKVKQAMEIVSALNECFQMKESLIRDLERDNKKYESLLNISEKERDLVQQQQREIIQSPMILNGQVLLQNLNKNNNHNFQFNQKPQQQTNSMIMNKENIVAATSMPPQMLKPKPSTQQQQFNSLPPRMAIQHQQLMIMTNSVLEHNKNKKERESSTQAASFMVNNVPPVLPLNSRGGSTKRLVSGAATAFLSQNASQSALLIDQQQKSKH